MNRSANIVKRSRPKKRRISEAHKTAIGAANKAHWARRKAAPIPVLNRREKWTLISLLSGAVVFTLAGLAIMMS